MLDFERLKPGLREFCEKTIGLDSAQLTAIEPVIQETFERLPGLTFEMVLKVLPFIKFSPLSMGDHFIKKGDENHKLAIIGRGLFRVYCINDDGDEITITLCKEGDSFTCWEPIFLKQPSEHYMQALEDSLVFFINYSDLKSLIDNDIELARVYYGFILKQFGNAMRGYQSVLNRKPQERYMDLYHNYPSIFSRTPKQIIASYIGVTPVSFSRLSKRMEEENTK